MIGCLRVCTTRFQLPCRKNAQIISMTRGKGLFRVHYSANTAFAARTIIITSNKFDQPFAPGVPKLRNFSNAYLRDSTCQAPRPFTNRHIIIMKTTGSTIRVTCRLTNITRISLTAHRGVQFFPRQVLKLRFRA